ncbi:four helix bundle protein [Terrimonas pollutisoli]|uniref:four helix bundle protein n=1 Tax=Terrimonas pollutisoli TaxID=3034147 RepID=UPI0023EB0012|nr:four helix bundle protein [Terrimonas sp. H1YJ31]
MDYTLEKLEVYNMAEEFSDEIWNIVDEWKFFLKDTIGKQIVRAGDSISANIAEGYGRYYYKESKQFYFYSRGSIQETKEWLGKCRRRKVVKEDKCDELLQKAEMILIKLNAYIKFVSKSIKHNPK